MKEIALTTRLFLITICSFAQTEEDRVIYARESQIKMQRTGINMNESALGKKIPKTKVVLNGLIFSIRHSLLQSLPGFHNIAGRIRRSGGSRKSFIINCIKEKGTIVFNKQFDVQLIYKG